MRKVFLIMSFLLLLCCKIENNKKKPFFEYFKMDITEKTDKLFSPKKTATIPFSYNKIYDPFTLEDSTINKSVFTPGKHNKIEVIVLDSVTTTMNVAYRKKKENLVQGFPVIITNTATLKTKHLLLHRGGALLLQEAKDKKGNWIEIERKTQEKMGDFYYKLLPKRYVYTKIPKYKGSFKTKLRVKLILDKKTAVFSNEFEGYVQPWMIK